MKFECEDCGELFLEDQEQCDICGSEVVPVGVQVDKTESKLTKLEAELARVKAERDAMIELIAEACPLSWVYANRSVERIQQAHEWEKRAYALIHGKLVTLSRTGEAAKGG